MTKVFWCLSGQDPSSTADLLPVLFMTVKSHVGKTVNVNVQTFALALLMLNFPRNPWLNEADKYHQMYHRVSVC